jgi:hypothetical protein
MNRGDVRSPGEICKVRFEKDTLHDIAPAYAFCKGSAPLRTCLLRNQSEKDAQQAWLAK